VLVHHFTLAVVLVGLAALGANGADQDASKFEGTWVCVSWEKKHRLPVGTMFTKGDGYTISAAEDKLFWQMEKVPKTAPKYKDAKLTVHIDSTKQPKQIDLRGPLADKQEQEAKGEIDLTHRGIYKFEGDKLVICYGIWFGGDKVESSQGPAKFEAGERQELAVFEREK